MSSRRRDRSRSPRARLRMDSYTKGGRSKVSPPRSREIDSVMKRARRSDSQSTYWNKKLLEVEEKDPNRWRHSGYKELYHHPGSSRSGSESGSHSKSRSRSGSASNKSSSPKRDRSKSPRSPRSSRRDSRVRSPRKARSPKSPRKESRARSPRDSRARSPRRDSRARSPRARSPRRESTLRAVRRESRGRSPRRSRSPVVRARTPKARTPRSPRSRSPRVRRRTPQRQPHHRQGRSASNSSETSSSCSDESCSVCSPKRKSSKERPRPKEPPPERKREVVQYRPPPFIERSRSRSFSVPRSKPPAEKKKKSKKADKVLKVNRAYIKREKHDSDSESSSGRGSTVDIVSSMGGPKLSLSERFGRMAQWSVDRDLEHRNLRITSGDRLTVEMDSPPSPLYPPYVTCLIYFLSSFLLGLDRSRSRLAFRRYSLWRFILP